MIAIATVPATPTVKAPNCCDRVLAGHDQFLVLLPVIRRHARRAFRHLGVEAREESVTATLAHAWVAFVRLSELGRAEIAYPSPLATYAVARVREGRSIGNQLNARDVTSIRCRRQYGVQIESLDDGDYEWREIVVEDRRAGPADIAAVRLDFTAWLNSLSRRDRRMAEILATGETTRLAAARVGLSVGRVSQLRRKLHEAWLRFQGELGATEGIASACA
jgi:hypothetical protein